MKYYPNMVSLLANLDWRSCHRKSYKGAWS